MSELDMIEEAHISEDEMIRNCVPILKSNVYRKRFMGFSLMTIGVWLFFIPIYQVL